jgi:ABC-type transport system involved in cytochrome bd biosynthesis fused ATPase/permease subunit
MSTRNRDICCRSGKSSLLQAILGNMLKLEGSVYVNDAALPGMQGTGLWNYSSPYV